MPDEGILWWSGDAMVTPICATSRASSDRILNEELEDTEMK